MPEGRALIIIAHPDDEIIGAGNWLANLPEPEKGQTVIAYLTDGAPEDPWFTRQAGFDTREEYAAARKQERAEALEIAGISPRQCVDFGFTDQQSWRHLVEITHRISDLIRQLQPDVLLTHPYEGGHPDHDSAAFAVRQAVTGTKPDLCGQVIEFTSYHAGPRGPETGRFLPCEDCPEEVTILDARQQTRKKAMLDCHRTQASVLARFELAEERFRPAPEYDFKQPPHSGTLYYEELNWGITGEMWRQEAEQALRLLNLVCNVCH